MADYVFDPPLVLARHVVVRTLAQAAAFARAYVDPRRPAARDGVLRRLEAASGLEEERHAADAFRAWAQDEGVLLKP
jgi:hypothetical protein